MTYLPHAPRIILPTPMLQGPSRKSQNWSCRRAHGASSQIQCFNSTDMSRSAYLVTRVEMANWRQVELFPFQNLCCDHKGGAEREGGAKLWFSSVHIKRCKNHLLCIGNYSTRNDDNCPLEIVGLNRPWTCWQSTVWRSHWQYVHGTAKVIHVPSGDQSKREYIRATHAFAVLWLHRRAFNVSWGSFYFCLSVCNKQASNKMPTLQCYFGFSFLLIFSCLAALVLLISLLEVCGRPYFFLGATVSSLSDIVSVYKIKITGRTGKTPLCHLSLMLVLLFLVWVVPDSTSCIMCFNSTIFCLIIGR